MAFNMLNLNQSGDFKLMIFYNFMHFIQILILWSWNWSSIKDIIMYFYVGYKREIITLVNNKIDA